MDRNPKEINSDTRKQVYVEGRNISNYNEKQDHYADFEDEVENVQHNPRNEKAACVLRKKKVIAFTI